MKTRRMSSRVRESSCTERITVKGSSQFQIPPPQTRIARVLVDPREHASKGGFADPWRIGFDSERNDVDQMTKRRVAGVLVVT